MPRFVFMPRLQTTEDIRLEDNRTRKEYWKRWGPYLSERQWGTVREDYSPGGTAWARTGCQRDRRRCCRCTRTGRSIGTDDTPGPNGQNRSHRDEKPDHLAVAFDAPAKTFRKEMDSTYKAGRKETPDLFRSQLPLIRQVLEALAIPTLEVEGVEEEAEEDLIEDAADLEDDADTIGPEI